ncbi:MAG: hypothetical protein K0U66_07485 [Gammaproteobacteria bacterium]|nr:hypothetical protein [Gammaproteobacteria bacterium]
MEIFHSNGFNSVTMPGRKGARPMTMPEAPTRSELRPGISFFYEVNSL